MAKPKGFEKPAGVKDYLPKVVRKLKKIENDVLACMTTWGYQQLITPTLEFYDTVGVASSTSDRKLFKLLDRNGIQIVLRSDMTAPIARVAASLLKDRRLPLRLSYHANVFRAFDEEESRGAEFYQTGVELVGDDSPEADAEVVALAISSLRAAGVRQFKIAIGHVGFLHALFEAALNGEQKMQDELKQCLLDRDYVGYRNKIRLLQISQNVKNGLEGLLALRGGTDVFELARGLSGDQTAQQSIQHLQEVWNILQAYDLAEHVMIDLTSIGDFSYYTGMTFEGYAAELGFPVCSGGRYDNLLSQFGRPAPATGFSLKTSRIIELIEDEPDEPEIQRILVIYDDEHRKEALHYAGEERSRNIIVETRRSDHDEPLSAGDKTENYFQGNRYQQVIRFIS